jgi:hypothetical protein
VSQKVESPYIRQRRDSVFYECSVCLVEFDGPGTRKGLAAEFAGHVRLKHRKEAQVNLPTILTVVGRSKTPIKEGG